MYRIALIPMALLLTACAGDRGGSVQTPSTPSVTRTSSRDAGLLPAGTQIEVRVNEEIRADSAAEGRVYPAELARDIENARGEVVARRGSPAELVVVAVEDPGRVRSGNVKLSLRSLTVNGRTYTATSQSETTGERGLGANRRTAEMVGGGAALGTVIGAAAGGAKGAAIGAIAGAAGGAAVQVLTMGKEVRVPAESVLTFRLEQPIQIETR